MKRYLRMTMVLSLPLMAAAGWAAVPATAPAGKILRLGAVTVDRGTRTVSFPAKVVKPGYMLEFLLCRTGTKEYESVLATDVLPHQIHAALLVLGLSPGLPAEIVGKTFYPPRGPAVAITLHWEDKQGKEHTAAASDWLAASGKVKADDNAAKPSRWIFIGSELTPSRGYAADEEGGIIAVANVAAAVLDVPMASTKSLKQRRYVLNEKTTPPAGTIVSVRLQPDKDAANAPYARALLEIEPDGRMAIDGMAITMGKLADWAEGFSDRHKNGRVIIRSAAAAPAGLAPQTQLELKLGGVYDFEFRVAPALLPLLPRTGEQLREVLEQWRKRFAQPEQELDDPGHLAEDILKQIERRRADLKKLDALWSEYEAFLRKQRPAQGKPGEMD